MPSQRQLQEQRDYAQALVDEWLKGMEIVVGAQAWADEMQSVFEKWCAEAKKLAISKVAFRRALRCRGVFVWAKSSFSRPVMINLRAVVHAPIEPDSLI